MIADVEPWGTGWPFIGPDQGLLLCMPTYSLGYSWKDSSNSEASVPLPVNQGDLIERRYILKNATKNVLQLIGAHNNSIIETRCSLMNMMNRNLLSGYNVQTRLIVFSKPWPHVCRQYVLFTCIETFMHNQTELEES